MSSSEIVSAAKKALGEIADTSKLFNEDTFRIALLCAAPLAKVALSAMDRPWWHDPKDGQGIGRRCLGCGSSLVRLHRLPCQFDALDRTIDAAEKAVANA